GRHPDQGGPHEHGGEPRGAGAVARSPPDRIRGLATRTHARARTHGQVPAQESDAPLPSLRCPLPPEAGVRDADRRVVSWSPGPRGPGHRDERRAGADGLVRHGAPRGTGRSTSRRQGRSLAIAVATADARPLARQARSRHSIGTITYRIALCHFGNVPIGRVQGGKYLVANPLSRDSITMRSKKNSLDASGCERGDYGPAFRSFGPY